MYVVLAELDKGPMLGRKREKLFSGNCPKIIQEKMFGIVLKYPEKILWADGKIPKISWKDFRGGRKDSKISWKGFGGSGQSQNWSGSLKEDKRENPTDDYPTNDNPTNDCRSPAVKEMFNKLEYNPMVNNQ